MNKLVCLAALLSYLLSPICSADCPPISKRTVSGTKPLASQLYASAKIMDMGAWKDGTFYTEQFHFIGTAQVANQSVYVTYIETIWGPSCRSTRRLIFFSATKKPIGQYYGISKPTLKENSLFFHPSEGHDSSVDISAELPKEIDGGDDYFPLQKQ